MRKGFEVGDNSKNIVQSIRDLFVLGGVQGDLQDLLLEFSMNF